MGDELPNEILFRRHNQFIVKLQDGLEFVAARLELVLEAVNECALGIAIELSACLPRGTYVNRNQCRRYRSSAATKK